MWQQEIQSRTHWYPNYLLAKAGELLVMSLACDIFPFSSSSDLLEWVGLLSGALYKYISSRLLWPLALGSRVLAGMASSLEIQCCRSRPQMAVLTQPSISVIACHRCQCKGHTQNGPPSNQGGADQWVVNMKQQLFCSSQVLHIVPSPVI